ncbi:hypothetical protein ES705_35374 [subsurface metagenome]
MEKALTAAMGMMFGLVMLVAVVNMAQAAQPTPQYTCPICGEPFFTYDELYSHFTTEHPAEPIEIIWE